MIRSLSAAVLASAVVAHSAVAADAQRGSALANQWCANCHVIGTDATAPASTQQGPPTLRSVAAMPPDQLRAFLIHPHGKMPDLSLSRSEINDLIAYIGSLK
ncbi:MAG: cytochrome c [Alphaproteobacteria bacterium]|nr:cytochrome c [Alphaproteobacteria bacterium]